jgi:hypothetical protein
MGAAAQADVHSECPGLIDISTNRRTSDGVPCKMRSPERGSSLPPSSRLSGPRSREEAAAALGELLDIDHRLAEGVLDLRVFDFLGQSHPDSGLGSWDHTQHEM